MFVVYIIFSEKLNRYYIGSAENLPRRIIEHNTGYYGDAFTKKGIPWVLFFVLEGLKSSQAFDIEKHIKKMKSVKYYQNLKLYPEMAEMLKIKYAET